jgi:hypothetical protein
MAEERNLGVARAVSETNGDEDATKAELQRRMEEARESISQTVTEIKDTVANQYQAVRTSVSEALDWREQYRKRPVIWNVGALSVGIIVGYSLGGAFMGGGGDWDDDNPWDVEDYEPLTRAASAGTHPPYEDEGVHGTATGGGSSHAPSYAAQAITGAAYSSPSYGGGMSPAAASAGDYGATYAADEAAAAGPDKPGLLERFKETRAYDRLQEEVSSLGDRFIDELAKVGQTVVLPALFSKVKEMFGVDLSNKQQGGGTQRQQTAGGGSSGASTGYDQGGAGGSSAAAGGATGGSAYGTSQNQGYGSSSSDRDDYGRGGGSGGSQV